MAGQVFGAVGMCLTGGLRHGHVRGTVGHRAGHESAVASLPYEREHRSALGLSDADLAVVQRRTQEDLCVMGLRFSGDKKSPPSASPDFARRWATSSWVLEIDSSPGNPWGYKKSATRC